eukprot:447028_1
MSNKQFCRLARKWNVHLSDEIRLDMNEHGVRGIIANSSITKGSTVINVKYNTNTIIPIAKQHRKYSFDINGKTRIFDDGLSSSIMRKAYEMIDNDYCYTFWKQYIAFFWNKCIEYPFILHPLHSNEKYEKMLCRLSPRIYSCKLTQQNLIEYWNSYNPMNKISFNDIIWNDDDSVLGGTSILHHQ